MPIKPDLLRYWELAVDHYSGIPCASHLRHARQSLKLGIKNMRPFHRKTVFFFILTASRDEACA
ncbi:MAG: hypothetical protein ISR54_03725 [Chlorobium phaeobacteroides]|nr:hypothetical protein [Chlorobium phaeobacteroides]